MIEKKYSDIIKIRTFEEFILSLFSQNKLSGTTHTYIGEEATAVALMKFVKESDKVFSNHRCHGHYLAYGGPEEDLLAEIMSKKTGLCQGRGGSQHIHFKNFFTNGIQGGIVPNAAGVAFADKIRGKDSNTVVFLGDGTLGQGVVYETFNIASIYELPVVFVIEDNQYAMSTKRSDAIAGNIKSRIEGFNVKSYEIESTDVDELEIFFKSVFDYINKERKPVCAIVHNYRLAAHSKGDDTRDVDEIELHKKNDPVKLIIKRIGETEYNRIKDGFYEKLVEIEKKLESEGEIEISIAQKNQFVPLIKCNTFLSSEAVRYVDQIRSAFENALKDHDDVVFIGEDIRDPYGGAFKATKGLSLLFNDRVLNMPISEACMTGLAVGMGLNGVISVVEMMFGDFITLGFDQLLNHASKYSWVYGAGVTVPMIGRVPMGAKRGYGPTHSQSLEKYLVAIPNVKVLAMSAAISPVLFYETLFNTVKEPTVVVENKKLYGQKSLEIKDEKYNDFFVSEINTTGFSSILFSIDPSNNPDFYCITYGGMLEEALGAAMELMIKDELQVDVISITQLSPLPIKDIKAFVKSNVPIIIVEEGTITCGIGAEIIARCVEYGIGTKLYRVATPDMPIPNGITLENQVIPDKNTIVNFIRGV